MSGGRPDPETPDRSVFDGAGPRLDHPVARFLRLAPRERWLVVRLGSWLVVLPALIRALSLDRLARVMEASRRSGRGDGIDPDRIVDLTRTVVAQHPTRAHRACLPRSLLLYRYLGRAGVDVRLRIGVSMEGGDLAGHSWVEVDGRPVGEPADPATAFRTVLAYPAEVPGEAA